MKISRVGQILWHANIWGPKYSGTQVCGHGNIWLWACEFWGKRLIVHEEIRQVGTRTREARNVAYSWREFLKTTNAPKMVVQR